MFCRVGALRRHEMGCWRCKKHSEKKDSIFQSRSYYLCLFIWRNCVTFGSFHTYFFPLFADICVVWYSYGKRFDWLIWQGVAITQENSLLDNTAKIEGWLARFPMFDWVGGRTSEMSAVGLLAAALQVFLFNIISITLSFVSITSHDQWKIALHLDQNVTLSFGLWNCHF